MPIAFTKATTAALKIESRSKMRCRGAESYGNASRSCWITHAEVGLKVALKWRISRRPWWITNQQYSTRRLAVGTVKKSIAAMPSPWFRRKASQHLCWPGSGDLRGM